MPTQPPRRGRIHGVDFSGAVQAGKKIWIASGTAEGRTLIIEECRRADSLPGSGAAPEKCIPALRRFIEKESNAVIGLDFPFGLPGELVQARSWEEFALTFRESYGSPKDFRRRCREFAHNRDLKRRTDVERETPFSPYNLRLFRQTYFGVRDLLAPLVEKDAVCVLPMQRPDPGKAWVVEICPASTLKREGLYHPYKGRDKQSGKSRRCAREGILAEFERRRDVSVATQSLRDLLLDDAGGDALDSAIAAIATLRAQRDPNHAGVGEPYAFEGYVFI